eukprot:scaffold3864_cov248-Pinguiococcus_pyrenoidosus.AAC.8
MQRLTLSAALLCGACVATSSSSRVMVGYIDCFDTVRDRTFPGVDVVGNPSNEDVWVFEAHEFGFYKFSTCHPVHNGFDTVLKIYTIKPNTYDPNTGTLELDYWIPSYRNDDSADCEFSPWLSDLTRPMAPGFYAIVVEAAHPNGGGGKYKLSLDCPVPISGYLPCDASVSGNTRRGGDDVDLLGHPSNENIYSFFVPRAGPYTFSTCDDNTNFNTFLRVYEVIPGTTTLNYRSFLLGDQIARNNNAGPSCEWDRQHSTIEGHMLERGHYAIVVEGKEEEEGRYTLHVTCPEIQADGMIDCGEKVIGNTRGDNSELGFPSGEDIYVLPVEETSQHIASTCEEETDFNTVIHVFEVDSYDEDTSKVVLGPRIATNNNDADGCEFNGLASELAGPLDPGNYAIVVEGVLWKEGNYGLSITCPDLCEDGITNEGGSVCCDASCGECGGCGCDQRGAMPNHGPEFCCPSTIAELNIPCVLKDDVGCLLGEYVPVDALGGVECDLFR